MYRLPHANMSFRDDVSIARTSFSISSDCGSRSSSPALEEVPSANKPTRMMAILTDSVPYASDELLMARSNSRRVVLTKEQERNPPRLPGHGKARRRSWVPKSHAW
ncbi:hypothetical protein B0H17DRAFT_1130536 [Mycena rosella]|uniref:Uncharacterized protein n=1 Tax=Mycena rosella TaxID=1033263 RepID=A0AAD7DQW7_MYCRO|nr:hypothetical protein B0H17DRAFT_1130536 [Mycena rosella]